MHKTKLDKYLYKDHRPAHILGKDQLKKFAVLAALVVIDDDYHFLFQKRAKGISQGDEISFPGGAFDQGQDRSFEDTAVRETCEELGIKDDQVEIVTQVDTFVGHVYIENFLGILKIDSLEDLNINKDEVAYVFSLPVQYFIDHPPEVYPIRVKSFSSEVDEGGERVDYIPVEALDLPPRYHGSWRDRDRQVYVYRTPFGTLWGITALIVHDTIKHYLEIKE